MCVTFAEIFLETPKERMTVMEIIRKNQKNTRKHMRAQLLARASQQAKACGIIRTKRWCVGLFLMFATSTVCVAQREIKVDMGLAMQPDEKISWMLDGKLGMFIHWGLYAGVGRGEWYMENNGVPIEEYRRLAYAESGDSYFDARDYNPRKWVELAKRMGARYMCLTAEHHDGYALFESHYPTAFTSMQTHNRDFVREYVEAVREGGLKVGLYKTLINWRYPGYYDVTGTDCKPNKFGYTTAAWHKEDARLMKEELYCQTRELMTQYGRIDHLFWDGGWLAQKGSDADGAFFWEPGKYLNPENAWPVNPLWQVKDSLTGRPLGLMGMVRQLQPDLVCNLRSGWCGDYTCEEGSHDVKGPIRKGVVEKCFTLVPTWAYSPQCEDPSRVMPLARLKRLFADCLVRNMVALVNVGPDRHGNIPTAVADRLADFGAWVSQHAEAIYGTRGGPWQPVDGQYGFTSRGNMVYIYLFGGYTGSSFTLPALERGVKVRRVRNLSGDQSLTYTRKNQAFTLHGLPAQRQDVTVVAVELNKPL